MKQRLKGRLLVLLLLPSILLIGCLLYLTSSLVDKDTQCKIKLKAVYSALVFYYDEYQRLPIYTEWYDLLIQEADVSNDCFQCRNGSLTINENHPIKWNAPTNMVLVYEGGLGWNQSGGGENILQLHQNGCYVLFSNGDIKYVKREDFSELIWSVTEN